LRSQEGRYHFCSVTDLDRRIILKTKLKGISFFFKYAEFFWLGISPVQVAVLNTLMNLQVPQKHGIFSLSESPLVYQEGFCAVVERPTSSG
jgi:hypothetical protein